MSPRPLALLALAVCSCGVSRTTVNRLQTEVQRDRSELEAARSSAAPLEAYARGLRAGSFGAPATFVFLTPAEIARAAAEWLPYEMPAQDLIGPDASGRVVVQQITAPQLLSRNRLKLRLFFRAVSLNIRNVPKAYAGHVQKVKEGAMAGVWADIEATVVFSPKTGGLSIRATCTDVNLSRHNDSTYRSQLMEYINVRMLNRPLLFAAPVVNGAPPSALFTTAHHVVLQYRQ